MTELEIQYGKNTVKYSKPAPPKTVHFSDREIELVFSALKIARQRIDNTVLECSDVLSFKSKSEMLNDSSEMNSLIEKLRAL